MQERERGTSGGGRRGGIKCNADYMKHVALTQAGGFLRRSPLVSAGGLEKAAERLAFVSPAELELSTLGSG